VSQGPTNDGDGFQPRRRRQAPANPEVIRRAAARRDVVLAGRERLALRVGASAEARLKYVPSSSWKRRVAFERETNAGEFSLGKARALHADSAPCFILSTCLATFPDACSEVVSLCCSS
jgi:hypothetical protein